MADHIIFSFFTSGRFKRRPNRLPTGCVRQGGLAALAAMGSGLGDRADRGPTRRRIEPSTASDSVLRCGGWQRRSRRLPPNAGR